MEPESGGLEEDMPEGTYQCPVCGYAVDSSEIVLFSGVVKFNPDANCGSPYLCPSCDVSMFFTEDPTSIKLSIETLLHNAGSIH